MLVLKSELPRSLAGSAEEVLGHLAFIGRRLGRQGEADRLARQRQMTLARTSIDSVFSQGLHEYLEAFLVENARLDRAIAAQFRFG
jgi:uncharacterized alpha-E superfamily protein